MKNQDYLEKVGMEFKVERTRQKMSRQVLSDRCGVSSRTIFQMETGNDSCRLDTLKTIADTLGKPLKDFV